MLETEVCSWLVNADEPLSVLVGHAHQQITPKLRERLELGATVDELQHGGGGPGGHGLRGAAAEGQLDARDVRVDRRPARVIAEQQRHAVAEGRHVEDAAAGGELGGVREAEGHVAGERGLIEGRSRGAQAVGEDRPVEVAQHGHAILRHRRVPTGGLPGRVKRGEQRGGGRIRLGLQGVDAHLRRGTAQPQAIDEEGIGERGDGVIAGRGEVLKVGGRGGLEEGDVAGEVGAGLCVAAEQPRAIVHQVPAQEERAATVRGLDDREQGLGAGLERGPRSQGIHVLVRAAQAIDGVQRPGAHGRHRDDARGKPGGFRGGEAGLQLEGAELWVVRRHRARVCSSVRAAIGVRPRIRAAIGVRPCVGAAIGVWPRIRAAVGVGARVGARARIRGGSAGVQGDTLLFPADIGIARVTALGRVLAIRGMGALLTAAGAQAGEGEGAKDRHPPRPLRPASHRVLHGPQRSFAPSGRMTFEGRGRRRSGTVRKTPPSPPLGGFGGGRAIAGHGTSAGLRTHRRGGFGGILLLLAVASQPREGPVLAWTAVVPVHRCGAVPESHRVPLSVHDFMDAPRTGRGYGGTRAFVKRQPGLPGAAEGPGRAILRWPWPA
ncbi:hypothetical protein STIAU_2173 [Stigmatella aurantiaca DW4/3-1]|uniref:Uncharacterized protein n=1 Tax=Stigmatella aurantiaca (strain DW4/3-1) TaxID=378806 RepID=Q08Y20_STIAD|nr:hypothetical protein STIAU_2173 [Stigmatella aurantiaca DW4/3-1]